jgi:hypothetical protein
MLKAAIAAYEHHVHYDRSGFPEVAYTPHLVSRVVAIADCYETLTSSHEGSDVLHTPYDALFLMQSRAGTLFDPLLLKVFVNAVGIYPVGSLVRLTSGEYAIVAEGPADPTFLDQPKVRIVRTGEGTLEPSEIIDLAEQSDDEATARGISTAVAPTDVFENVAEYISAL